MVLRVWFEDDDSTRMGVRVVSVTPPAGSAGAACTTTTEGTIKEVQGWLAAVVAEQERRRP
ncbi:hypothetical protein GCM10023320_23750 [Pseudonocardia adelaidensis]|uniref:Activator of Hsp90 ATPase-like protein n=1 Tax=Pseudonocardia adelaidensis TaxID=648754 RepID=A0ABP9NGQ0_9PSEU